jgi:hypothetical protein
MARRARKHRAEAKPQQARRHPQPWESDLNPKRLQRQNIGPSSARDFHPRTAADVKVCADRSEKKASQELRKSRAKKENQRVPRSLKKISIKLLQTLFPRVTHLHG